MIDIIDGINRKVKETKALLNGVTNGFHLNHPGQDTSPPFIVMVPISAVPEFNTSKKYVQPVELQFSFFLPNLTDYAALIKAWRNAFTRQAMTLDEGTMISAELVDEGLVDDQGEETEQFNATHYFLQFTFTQLQAHA